MMQLIRRIRRIRRRDDGQSLVEFALLTPILMIFVVAVIDFGLMLYTYQTITNAAREGARRAALADADITDAVVLQAVKTSLDPAVDTTKVQFVSEDGGGCAGMTGSTGGFVLVYACGWSGTPSTTEDATVSIQMDYQTMLLGRFLNGGRTDYPLKTRMVMRNE